MGWLFLRAALIVFIHATAWFVVSIWKKRNDVADVAWGLGFVLVGLFLLVTQPVNGVFYSMLILVFLWGLRLSIYIFLRNRKKSEDFRYQAWRKEWAGHFYLRSYLQVFVLQAGIALVVISPLLLAAVSSPDWSWWSIAGLTVWCIGFICQVVADHQLNDFLKHRQDKNSVLQTGLWRHSRHPNYLGEILMWWGIFLFVVPIPYGFIFVVSPVLITCLLYFVSGVPLIERKYEFNLDYQHYKARTPAIFPFFKKPSRA